MMEKTRDEDPDRIRKREGGPFEQRIAEDVKDGGLQKEVEDVISKTVKWPSFTQSLKSVFTAGTAKSWRYASEKRAKAKAGAAQKDHDAVVQQKKDEQTETLVSPPKVDEYSA